MAQQTTTSTANLGCTGKRCTLQGACDPDSLALYKGNVGQKKKYVVITIQTYAAVVKCVTVFHNVLCVICNCERTVETTSGKKIERIAVKLSSNVLYEPSWTGK